MNDYREFFQPSGFHDKLDPSLLNVYGLTRGSYNTLINDRGNIAKRKGYTLFGQEGSQSTGTKSAWTWENSTNQEIPLRTRYDALQVLYNDEWVDVLTGLKSNYKLRFGMWWDKTELKDVLLAVNSSTVIYSWTGGITEIASWTSTTLSKKYAKAASVGNTFTFSAAARTIVQSTDTDFITLGFVTGDVIRVIGTVSNNGIYTISSVTTTTITLSLNDVLVNEVISATTAIVGVNGKETWAAERFTTTGTKTINIAGTTFTYNAGWNSPTLTLTADPSAQATVDGIVFQTVISNTPVNGDVPSGLIIDRIGVNLNQVYIGNSQSRNVYLSKQSSFYDFGYTITVRVTGEGGTLNLDNNLVSLAPDDDKMVITAGKSDVYRVNFKSFSDGVSYGEIIECLKLKTSYGQAAVSPEAFVKIKNGTIYMSREPTIDFLGNVELIQGQQSNPLSDPIKRLLLSLDNTDVSGVYTKNNVFFLFPSESVLLMYDTERAFWQPPQIISGSCLSVVDGNVIVHSGTTDESYTLFSGMTDNGVLVDAKAVTNAFTSGKRTARKTYDEVFVEVIVNGNANTVNCSMYSGYNGATGIATFQVGADDDARFIEETPLGGGFGTYPFGSIPFGSLFPDVDDDSEIGSTKKIYKVQGQNRLEAFTQQMQFQNSEENAYFEIVSWGFNPQKTATSLVDIMA